MLNLYQKWPVPGKHPQGHQCGEGSHPLLQRKRCSVCALDSVIEKKVGVYINLFYSCVCRWLREWLVDIDCKKETEEGFFTKSGAAEAISKTDSQQKRCDLEVHIDFLRRSYVIFSFGEWRIHHRSAIGWRRRHGRFMGSSITFYGGPSEKAKSRYAARTSDRFLLYSLWLLTVQMVISRREFYLLHQRLFDNGSCGQSEPCITPKVCSVFPCS